MTTSRSNAVVLRCSAITNVQYVDNSFAITTGQPYTLPPVIVKTGDDYVITVDCGRSASDDVANAFNETVGSAYHEFTGPYLDSSGGGIASTDMPEQLNFYFAVDVWFTGLPNPLRVYLGQGSIVHLTNNWWIAGTPVLNSSPGYSTVCYFAVNASNLYLVSCPYDGSTELLNTFDIVPAP